MEQMFTPNRMGRIGVYPDGSPVVYSPEKAAEKRKEIAEKLKAQLEAQGKDTSNLRINFAPELEPENNIDRVPKLERSPKTDEVMLFASKPDMLCAKVTPTDAMAWMQVFDIFAGLIQKYGPGVIDFINDTFGNGKDKNPELAMKNVLVMNSIIDNNNQSESKDEGKLPVDDATKFYEMHYDKPYFN